MTEHTKEPWHIDGKPGREALEIHSEDRRIAKALYEYGSEDHEADANARLIAAAPDLLVACEYALGELRRLTDVLSDEDIALADECIASLEAAARKAKGDERP